MTPQRGATLVFGGALLALWLAAAAGPYEAPRAPRLEQAASETSEPLLVDVQKQAARLRERLDSAPVPLPAGRNPFSFGPRPVPAAPREAARVASPSPDPAPPIPIPEPRPEISLVGIGEDRGESGAVRTAIVSGFGEVFVVKPGGDVGGRYRVVAIGADAIELLDLADNSTLRIGLK